MTEIPGAVLDNLFLIELVQNLTMNDIDNVCDTSSCVGSSYRGNELEDYLHLLRYNTTVQNHSITPMVTYSNSTLLIKIEKQIFYAYFCDFNF